jgi:hypothetical protein
VSAKLEEAERDAWHAKQCAEETARLDGITAEARRRGACVPCALESARHGREPKYTKHRANCPRGDRR